MKLTIDNRDLSFTIDTYGMFTGESCDEMEREYYRDEYDMTDDESSELQFNYDHQAIVEAFAVASIDLLHNEFVTHGDIVKDIRLVKTGSPSYYNFTTDYYRAEWTFNSVKLKQWINEHDTEYWAFIHENWGSEWYKVQENGDKETQYAAMLDFYTQTEYDREDYESHMFEHESHVYSENMTLDEESQKLIDSKGEQI